MKKCVLKRRVRVCAAIALQKTKLSWIKNK